MTEKALDVATVTSEPAANPVDTSQPSPQLSSDSNKSDIIQTQEKPIESKPISLLQKIDQEVKQDQEYWKDDWKQKISGDDVKLTKILEKYKSPRDLANGYIELQKKLSTTRPIPQLQKDATPEQIKEYREASGIPESWEKYDTNLENGIVIGESDKPIINKHLQKFHEMNLQPEVVKKVLQSHFEISNALESERLKLAEHQQEEVAKELQKEWGVQYKDNINLIANHLTKSIGAEELTKLNQAVLPDGTYLVNNPKILNHLFKQAKQEMGGNTITPTSTSDFISLTERKNQLEKIAAQDPKAWYNNREARQELSEISANLHKKRG